MSQTTSRTDLSFAPHAVWLATTLPGGLSGTGVGHPGGRWTGVGDGAPRQLISDNGLQFRSRKGQKPVHFQGKLSALGISQLNSRPRQTRTLLNGAEHGIELSVVVETPHREAIVPLVLEGVGSAFVTRFVAREAQKRGAVVLALEPQISYDVYLIHRAKPLTRAAAAFVNNALLLRSMRTQELDFPPSGVGSKAQADGLRDRSS